MAYLHAVSGPDDFTVDTQFTRNDLYEDTPVRNAVERYLFTILQHTRIQIDVLVNHYRILTPVS